MAQNLIFVTLVCLCAAYVQSAPQTYQQYQQRQAAQAPLRINAQPQYHPQTQEPERQSRFLAQPQYQPKIQEPERQSRFKVVDNQFHQDANLEYNFE